MKRKHVILIAGSVIQICFGIFYIWSIFQGPVMKLYGWTNAQASTVFYIMLAANVAGIIAGGRIYYNKGPRFSILLSGGIFAAGLFLSSWVPKELPGLLYIFYGGMGGFGVGMGYNTILTCAQKWWPDKRGLAVGITVGAFGFSTVIFTPIVNSLISDNVLGVSWTFRALAIGFFVIVISLVWLIKNPPKEYTEKFIQANPSYANQRQYSPMEVIKTKEYYLMLICFICLPSAYYILNPLLKSLGEMRGLPETAALVNVMITGIANAAGRLTFARMTDIIGAKKVMYMLYGIMFVASALLSFAQSYLFIVIIAFVAFAYGGCSAVTPVMAADFFGTKHVGSNFGLVMIAISISGLGIPPIANLLSINGMPTPLTFVVPAIASVIGLIVCVINKPKKESVLLK